jgi:hypothetical protein
MRSAAWARMVSSFASRARVAVDVRLQLGALEAECLGLQEHGRDAGIDHRRFERSDARHLERIDEMAGREHRTTRVARILGRIEEFQFDLGRRERHAIELEIAEFDDVSVTHGNVRDDRLADVLLPDPHRCTAPAVARQTRCIHQSAGYREGAYRRTQVAAVARPVHEGLLDRDLAVQIVDIVIGHARLRNDHRLAGARRRPAHAVGVLRIRIRRTDHAHQQRIPRSARHLRFLRQVFQHEEHALAGAAAHVGGGDHELGWETAHAAPARKSCAKRCSTPPAS